MNDQTNEELLIAYIHEILKSLSASQDTIISHASTMKACIDDLIKGINDLPNRNLDNVGQKTIE